MLGPAENLLRGKVGGERHLVALKVIILLYLLPGPSSKRTKQPRRRKEGTRLGLERGVESAAQVIAFGTAHYCNGVTKLR